MHYHVWFSTKRRAPALVDDIDEAVRRTFAEVSRRDGIDIVEIKTALDHVHLLIDLQEDQSLPVVMHDLKGAAARRVFLLAPHLRFDLKGDSFWQKSYGARRVPPEQVEVVRHYIRTQDERPLRSTDMQGWP